MNRPLKDTEIQIDNKAEAQPIETQIDPLLIKLTPEQQAELVAIVKEDYRNAVAAREQRTWGVGKDKQGLTFDEKLAGLLELYEGADQSRPEAWMCARSLKIAQAIVEMAVARLYPMVMNEDLMRWREVRKTDKLYVAKLNRLMEWVLLVQMKVRHDILMLIRGAASLGTAYIEPVWKRTTRVLGKKELVVLLDELGQPQLDERGDPLMTEQRVKMVDQRSALRLLPIEKVLLQPGASSVYDDDPVIVIEDFRFSELDALAKQGLAENIEQLQRDVDTRVATETGLTLEKSENIANFQAKRRNMPVECLRWLGKYDADGDGVEEDVVVLVSNREEVFLRCVLQGDLSPTGQHMITQVNWIDRIGGKALGIGLLEQVKPLAEEVDACFRQLTDANTLSVMRWGFYDPSSDYDPDEHVAKPRAMYPVSNPSQNVYFPDMQIPIERLLNAIRTVMEFIERLTAASSYMMGKESDIVGGSGTATRTQAIVSAADTRFNLPATNIREGVAECFTNVFRLNAENMPDGMAQRILGTDGEPIFADDADMRIALQSEISCYLIPPADLGDANTRRQLAANLYDRFMENPLVINDINRVWYVSANLLRAYGEDPVEFIGKPSSAKPTNDPVEENVMIRDGRSVPVEPQENHLEHMMVHSEELQGQRIIEWPPARVKYLRGHIIEHQQMMARLMQQPQENMKPGKGGEDNGAESGTPSAIRGGAAIVGGMPDVSASPTQAEGTIAQQTAGAEAGSQ